SFEITGINQPLIDKFSKRHQAINKSLDTLLEDRPELAGGNVKDMREIIAHAERPDKVKMTNADLMEHWQKQLTHTERHTLSRQYLLQQKKPTEETANLDKALAWSENHLFARRSVVDEHELLRFALEKARGENFTLDELKECLKSKDHYLRNNEKHPRQLTTKQALATELKMVSLARNGKWEYHPFHTDYPLEKTKLADDQKEAVRNLLISSNFITLFRGGAGVGKSFALAEVQKALHDAEYHTITLAPQRQQVIDLEKDGLINTNTVSGFLAKQEMPQDSVILLDEGGQISAKQMLELFQLVKEFDGRIICSGDTRQHGAVEASDAMRAIEKHTGIFPVSLNTIRRQDPEKADSAAERAFILEYRKAVKSASEGVTHHSFDRLDQLGAIKEVIDDDPANLLAIEYADKIQKGQSAVTVSQTWDEIQRVNEAIRKELKSRNLIDAKDHKVTTLKPIDLTNAQKQDKRYHPEDTVVVFNRDFKNFKKGEQATFLLSMDDRLVVQGDNKIGEITLKKLDYVSVFKKQEMALAAGDKIQLKVNGKSEDGKRLANGELVTVKSIDIDNAITLTDGRRLNESNRQFVRGYAITSYGSQGKTADHVFLCDSAIRAATNKQQWYVSISRARKGISIYTRDKLQLRQNVYRLSDEKLALDFVGEQITQKIDYTNPVWITSVKQVMDRQEAFRLANQTQSNKVDS
ncbi:MAG: AAA family ATPase, partial [Bacteroidota bacterium]